MMRRELVTGYITIKGVKVKRKEEHRDRLLNIIREINSLASHSVIIVEGNTDEQAILPLVFGQIEVLIYPKLRRHISRNHFHQEYLILTDFDEEGEKLHKVIKQMILDKGIKENRIRDDVRDRIRALLTIYGYSIYDAISNLKKSVDIDLEGCRIYVMSDYSHLLYDNG